MYRRQHFEYSPKAVKVLGDAREMFEVLVSGCLWLSPHVTRTDLDENEIFDVHATTPAPKHDNDLTAARFLGEMVAWPEPKGNITICGHSGWVKAVNDKFTTADVETMFVHMGHDAFDAIAEVVPWMT